MIRGHTIAIGIILVAAFFVCAEQPPLERIRQIETLLNQGQKAQAKREGEAFRKELEKQAADKPDNAETHYLLGRVIFLAGDDDAAASRSIDTAVRLSPKTAEYRVWKGHLLREKKETAAAIAEYRTASELAPDDIDILFTLIHALTEAGQGDEAGKLLNARLAKSPGNPRLLGALGALRLDAKDEAAAIDLYQQAVKADPKYFNGWYNLGQIHQNLQKPAAALSYFQKAAEITPTELQPRAKIIQCLQAIGKTDERDKAIAQLRELHTAGKIRATFFCRDQFTAGENRVFALEYFKPIDQFNTMYSFNVMDATGKKSVCRITLESDDATTAIARELKSIGPNQRSYSIDRFDKDSHATLAMLNEKPSYDDLKKMVIESLEGKRKPLSESHGPGK